MVWCGVVCCGVVCCAVVWCGVVWCGVLCCAVLCCAVLCCAVLCCAVLCCAVLCCAVLCYAMPCYAMLSFAMACHRIVSYRIVSIIIWQKPMVLERSCSVVECSTRDQRVMGSSLTGFTVLCPLTINPAPVHPLRARYSGGLSGNSSLSGIVTLGTGLGPTRLIEHQPLLTVAIRIALNERGEKTNTDLLFFRFPKTMSTYQLYRNTTLGHTLQESLDELIQVVI